MTVINTVLDYDCDANNPCSPTSDPGSTFPHSDPTKYIVCGPECNVLQCPMGRFWDQQTAACVSNGF